MGGVLVVCMWQTKIAGKPGCGAASALMAMLKPTLGSLVENGNPWAHCELCLSPLVAVAEGSSHRGRLDVVMLRADATGDTTVLSSVHSLLQLCRCVFVHLRQCVWGRVYASCGLSACASVRSLCLTPSTSPCAVVLLLWHAVRCGSWVTKPAVTL